MKIGFKSIISNYMLIDFKDEDFENKIKNEDISVIQFVSAAWCGPCKSFKARNG